jgi:peptidoglycan/xylan/chitin deacetylase (PgdA/CDA1 family)
MVSELSGLGHSMTGSSAASALEEKSIVLSIDFEMRWGRHDRLRHRIEDGRETIEGGVAAVPEILSILSTRHLRATWAAVGAIGCKDWDEYFRLAPPPPAYQDRNLAVKRSYVDLDPHGTLHFSPESLTRICRTPGQELGTHTFSHIYVREPGATSKDLIADLQTAAQLYERAVGKRPISLVFPRNQANFLEVLPPLGIKVWRANPRRWYHDRHEARSNNLWARGLRYLDSIFPVAHLAATPEEMMCPASVFLRFDLPEPLWRAHVRRIMRQIQSMRRGELVHLWFHEHNLGQNTGQRRNRLTQICDLLAENVSAHKAVSRHMGDFAA